ncbi:DUF6622 family protein [Caenimonas koreensis]|uniref:DUF6622 family protein n=1 Tax=Caenimonas koreensis TaxID=367474 RepID=UPI001E449E5F|nr:DUF6622 family protein [Caenimonas koreensis]
MLLIQLIAQHPEAIGQVLKNTPAWVGGLLAGLTVLGASQARDRTASVARIAVMPVVMTGLSIWGMVSAFGNSPMFGWVMITWMFAAAVMLALVAPQRVPQGTTYDPLSRTFFMRGSWIPMVLILGIFLTKYIVGVDTAMNPGLARDAQYTLVVGGLYGLFSGLFAGRAARLLKLAFGLGHKGVPA